MKKMFLGIIIGLSIVGVAFAAEILMDAKSISYSSEYTDKDNVADAISELLEGGDNLSDAKVDAIGGYTDGKKPVTLSGTAKKGDIVVITGASEPTLTWNFSCTNAKLLATYTNDYRTANYAVYYFEEDTDFVASAYSPDSNAYRAIPNILHIKQ